MHRNVFFYRQIILWLWCGWALVWVIAALRSKATQRRESLWSRLAHVVPLIIGGVLLGWRDLPWGVLTLRLWPRSLGAYLLGLALLVVGLGVAVWARVHLGRNWSGTVSVKEGHELIRTGPYAYVRHPMYAGAVWLFVGMPLALGSWWPIGLIVFVVPVLLWRLLDEERILERDLRGYREYQKRVRHRLIPYVW